MPWLWAAIAFGTLMLLVPARGSAQSGRRAAPEGGEAPNGALAELRRLEGAFQELAREVAPSVVGIRTERRLFTAIAADEADDALLRTIEQLVVVNGSGTVISEEGLILTNEHVVQAASRIDVFYHDGQSEQASVLAADARSDLAVLRVTRRGLPPARFCDWETVAPGQWTFAIGNPYGLGADGRFSVSVGIISNLGRHLPGLGESDDRLYNDMVQTTAQINPGNSGGPLFNLQGEVIGVITAMHTRAGVDEGIGFAVPMAPVKRRIIRRLQAGEQIEYGYLGLTVRSPGAAEREAAGIAVQIGAYVQDVEPAGPAAQSGVQIGDIILAFDGRAIRSTRELIDAVGGAPVDRRIELRIARGSERRDVIVTIARREIDRVTWMRGGAILWRGMRLADVPADGDDRATGDRRLFGVVVLDVLPGSPAERAGLRAGEVIDQIDGTAVRDVIDFRRRVRAAKGAIAVHVERRGEITVQP